MEIRGYRFGLAKGPCPQLGIHGAGQSKAAVPLRFSIRGLRMNGEYGPEKFSQG